jgi:hypothetical protein
MQGVIELDLVQHVSDRQRRRRVLMWERFWAQKIDRIFMVNLRAIVWLQQSRRKCPNKPFSEV